MATQHNQSILAIDLSSYFQHDSKTFGFAPHLFFSTFSMNHHSVVRNFGDFGFVAFQILVPTVQVLQQVWQLAHSCLLRPNTTTNIFRAFLDLILGWSKKTTESTQTQNVEQTVSGAVCFTKRNLLEPQQFHGSNTSPSRQPAARSKSST